MNIHEYQTKQIFRHYGIPVADFYVTSTLEEVLDIVDDHNFDQAVIKVQIHAGGRGKAGGVKIGRSRPEIVAFARQLLGMKIVNNQTGPQGVVARRIMIAPLIDVSRELYMSIVIDREHGRATLIASKQGGMEIEEVAAQDPKSILKLPITTEGKIREYNLQRLVNFMGWKEGMATNGRNVAKALAKVFVESDASMIEINPLVETKQGELIALDAKCSIDDNALFRQPIIAGLYDPTQLSFEEVQARLFDLAYVGLDGHIGCMVNGAGLAMATMDIIKLHGGAPANFLDVGGGASQDKVAEGFKIILADSKVKAILVNIFGGIMNCDTLAAGIVAAAAQLQVKVPLIVRMEGTNVEQGKKRLYDSGLNITIAPDLNEAAKLVVAAANH